MWQVKKTWLAAVIASLPMVAWGLTPVGENQLSEVAGQAGITVTVQLPSTGVTWSQTIYDRDGVPADGYGNASVLGINTSLFPGSAGALTTAGLKITSTGSFVWTTDAGRMTGNKSVLNMTFNTTGITTFHMGDLRLSIPLVVGGWALDTTKTKTIASAGAGGAGMDISIGATSMNMQLGNVPQTMQVVKPVSPSATTTVTYNPMLLTDLTIQNGVHITNMTVMDVSDPNSSTYAYCGVSPKKACSQTIADIYINDNTGTLASTKTSNLTLKGLGMSVTSNGLVLAANQVGYRDGSNVDHGINVQMENVHLGDTNVPGMGNLYLQGLQLGRDATLTIAGH